MTGQTGMTDMTNMMDTKLAKVKEIADAVLYEGYLLYPYRRSSIKNRRRWTFGVVYPREYSEANGGIEPSAMHTECLLTGTEESKLSVTVRFLHLLTCTTGGGKAENAPVQSQMLYTSEWNLETETWEEGIEREVSAVNLSLRDLLDHPQVLEIAFPSERMVEEPTGKATTPTVREQQSLAGTVTIAAERIQKTEHDAVGADVSRPPVSSSRRSERGRDTSAPTASDKIYRVSVHIENVTTETGGLNGNTVIPHSFVSTHAILGVEQGNFVSLLDPPDELKAIVQECKNQHTWPIMVGDEGETTTLLSSPIILYDYPQIAPESPGSLFDGTEIDEILTLRIMTLTDEEKQEMREGDERAREILERTESLSPEQFMKLHGVIRGLGPVSSAEEGEKHEEYE